jgi:hypothetical protein
LNYMHNNPVKRGLLKQPGNRPWSHRSGSAPPAGRKSRGSVPFQSTGLKGG